MIKNVIILKLAVTYLCRYRRRYFFLFLALVFGFGIVTVITSVKDGMYENVYNSSQSHYAGDLVVLAQDTDFSSSQHMKSEHMAAVMRAAENTRLDFDHVVKRTNCGSRGGVLYFNGTAVDLKYVIGVDWDAEASYFGALDYTEAPLSPLKGDDGIVLSSPVSRALGARQGDSLVVETETRMGWKNTALYTVSAVVNDATIFGYYKAYVSRLSLNRLLEFADGECSSMGFYFRNRLYAEKKKAAFQAELEKLVQTGPLVESRAELDSEAGHVRPGITLFVTSIPVLLSEISDLLNAMNILTWFLYVMMLLIILVSAAVTFRLILHERVKELGTMRAIGFYESDVTHVLVLEVFGLGFLSLAGGFAAARVIVWGLGFLSFSWFPSFEIFMKDDRLTALYRLPAMLANVAVLFCMLFAAVWFPAFRFVRSPLPRLLQGL
ncbi:MAG: ABC transporter permease [Treponema sp.]|jgi:ABC-type lipoprotein release transport system permease subunit|nr:ABC transporter permease [Treponema sp.]